MGLILLLFPTSYDLHIVMLLVTLLDESPRIRYDWATEQQLLDERVLESGVRNMLTSPNYEYNLY